MTANVRECVRCGYPRVVRPDRPTAGLCLDCTLVVRDLDELERWAS